MDLFPVLQELSRLCGLDEGTLASRLSGLGLESPPEVQDTTDDEGHPIRRISTAKQVDTDLSIPLGTWTLRLIPTPTGTPGEVRIPIQLICSRDDGSFRELRVELARFELEADRNHLIAANLHTEPQTHLRPMQNPPPVKLLGPGFTLILGGEDLDDWDAEFSGAVGGMDPDFPSVRFEPPHFMIARGGTPTDIGVVCDEVLLDLRRGESPPVPEGRPELDDNWRGLVLKELGIFIGDGDQVGTWSGMASMKDFYIGFDAVDLSGLFTAELVHYVLEHDPQVQIRIYYQNDDGAEELASDDGSADIPAPTGDNEYRRVRLEAAPNWDSAGFRVDWNVPAGVTVEEPLRLSNLNLGWLRVPPGFHEFAVKITDHRVSLPPEVDCTVTVGERTVGAGETATLKAIFDGILDDPAIPEEDQRPTNRLHMTMRPNQGATLRARISGGTGTVEASLTLPLGFTPVAPPTHQVSHVGDSIVYELVEWTIGAPGAVPADPHAAIELTVVDGGDSTEISRRLRVTVEDGLPDGHRDFSLVSYSDWRADVGIGLARVQPLYGLEFSDITWTLASEPVDDSLFTDAGLDALFNGGSYTDERPADLANSAGTVRPFLHTDNRLWRLTGQVDAGSGAIPARAPIVVGEPTNSRAMTEASSPVRGFLGDSAPSPEPYAPGDGSTVRTVLFHYDCSLVLPPDADHTDPGDEPRVHARVGPEADDVRLSFDETTTEQVRGFAALFRAIEHYGSQIEAIGLFGAASVEGPMDHNQRLSGRRRDAVLNELRSPSPELTAAMAALAPEEDRPRDLDAVSTLVNDLADGGAVTSEAFGDEYADSVINPQNRRVFAVLKLSPGASDRDITHSEYFVTLPGEPGNGRGPDLPRRKLQDHPFRHAVFRMAHVEVELLHNELTRLQVRLKLDLEAFNENDDALPGDADRPLNYLDGLMTFFLEMRRNPDPEPDEPEYSWEFVALSDPGDLDGIALLKKPDNRVVVDMLGPPAIVTPALTALSGGRMGITAFVLGLAVGEILTTIPTPDDPVLVVQTLIWRGIRFRLLHGNVTQVALSMGVDYTVRYNLDADLSQAGIPLTLRTDPANPIEVSFRNVGVEVRWGSFDVEFFYNPAEGFQLDINDPGVFQLGDGIGRLLQVNRFRTGAGSPLWFEVELALALETGIFSVTTLRVRFGLDTDQLFQPGDGGAVTLGAGDIDWSHFSISVNKLGVAVDVPGVLEGGGEFGFIEEDGETTIEGEIDIKLVPLDLGIYGGLKIYTEADLRAVYAYLGVEFAPGITLGPTGAAIYGFFGLVGVNMGRAQLGSPGDDPATQALAWFAADPPGVGVTDTDKWQPNRGSWAFGVGTVVGTAYDNGFSFNTKGAFILEIPGPKFLLATESKFLETKPQVGDQQRGNLLCIVMLDLENDILLIGMDFRFVKENLIDLRVPVEVFFNLARAADWHIRFGQPEERSKWVSLTLLNSFKAWGYLALEGDGLDVDDALHLEGICMALGARIEVFWGSRPINLYLEAYAELHLGLQMNPILLQGVLKVGGELHLVVVSVEAHGELRIIAPDPFVLRGEICGKLDLWLFSIEGCADFTIGDRDAQLPDPENPFKELVLIDRMTSAAVSPPDEGVAPRAPLDAVLHLIFAQDMIDDRPESQRGTSLSDRGRIRNQVSDDLFYEYYLSDVRIVRTGDGVVVDLLPEAPEVPAGRFFNSAWAPYSLPKPSDNGDGGNGDAAHADSMRTLRLLDWIPNAHPRALDFTSGYGETVRLFVDNLCNPAERPSGVCATFDEEPIGLGSSWLLDRGELAPVRVVNTQGTGLGSEYLGSTLSFSGGRVVSLVSVAYPDRAAKKRCLELPASKSGGQFPLSEILGDWENLLSPGNGVGAAQLWLLGLLIIRLPDVVAAELTFVVPERLAADGEVVFLDADVKPLTPVLSIQAADEVAGSVGSGSFTGYVARRLGFGPPEDSDADPNRARWVVVKPPGTVWMGGRDRHSYLTDICGIPHAAWQRWRDRVGDKERTIIELQGQTGIVGGVPAVSAQDLLDPGTEYRVEGTISWARFRDATDAADAGTGQFEDPHDASRSFSATFQTVGEDEYPRQIRRYVLSRDPPDDGQPHYYGEPVQITFRSDVIDDLFAKFGKQLVAWAKADTGTHVLSQPLSAGTERQFFPMGSFEETLYDVLTDLQGECLPGNWEQLFPKDVFSFEALTENTGYTIALLPRPLGEPESLPEVERPAWDAMLQTDFDGNLAVYRFDIRTSRWASFGDHFAAYQLVVEQDGVGDLIADDEASLATALAEIAEDRADASIDRLCAALFGGPLALPDRPQVTRIWVQTDDAGLPAYRCRAILLDGPEPLLKRRGDGSPRTELEFREAAACGDAFDVGMALAGARVIAGARGARLFVLFDPADAPPFVHIRLRDRPVSGGSATTALICVEVGDTPGSFDEEGD